MLEYEIIISYRQNFDVSLLNPPQEKRHLLNYVLLKVLLGSPDFVDRIPKDR